MPFISNSRLDTITLPFEWKGTPTDENGRFVNLEFPFVDSLKELWKWQTSKNPQKEEKKNDRWHLNVTESGFIESDKDCIVWLGHATFFIRLSGVTFLIDPVLLDSMFLRRLSPLPISVSKLTDLNYILISHDHRDHCDEKSLKFLAKNNPEAVWLTGLNMAPLLSNFTKSNKIQSAGWYQQYETVEPVKITFIPSRHWGKRSLNDTNLRLWGGFMIQTREKTICFCGDSGYDHHFTDLAEIFGQIDFCMIGIGAYKPEYFMGQSHTSPVDAIKAFQDLKAKVMIPMHYGTFDLSDEPIGDPLRVLNILQKRDDIVGIKPLDVGEMLLV